MRVAFGFFLVAVAWSSGAIAATSHKSLHDRFTEANTTHDGHLTLEQAKTGMKSVARRFDAIDKDHRGYVTEDDIRAYLQVASSSSRVCRDAKELNQ